MIILLEPRLLLDTNIVTYISSETEWKTRYEPIVFGKELHISFMTLAELLEGAYYRKMSAKNIQNYLNNVRLRYPILPSNDRICEYFARIRYQRRTRPISVPDALIAATALAYDLPLVTHNADDFTGIDGLRLITCYKEGE